MREKEIEEEREVKVRVRVCEREIVLRREIIRPIVITWVERDFK